MAQLILSDTKLCRGGKERRGKEGGEEEGRGKEKERSVFPDGLGAPFHVPLPDAQSAAVSMRPTGHPVPLKLSTVFSVTASEWQWESGCRRW